MSRLPVLRAREVIRILRRLDFSEIRHRGSHKQFAHPNGRRTTVPVHPGRDIAPVLLRRIIKDTGFSVEEFLSHR